jgi:hypothetical protein
MPKSLSVSLCFLVLLAHGAAADRHDMGFAARLPEETSFYVTTERLDEIVSAIASSNFYTAFYEVPAIKDAVTSGEFPDLRAKWDEMMTGEQGPMVQAAVSLFEKEIVLATTCDGSKGLLPGIVHVLRTVLLAQEYKMGGMDQEVGNRLRQVAAGLSDRLGLEPFVLAFKSNQKEVVGPMIAGVLTQIPPELAQMMTSEELGGVAFTTFSVMPAMFFPPDKLVDPLREVIQDSTAIETIVSAYVGLTLKARLGWIDDYLVLVLEDGNGRLALQLAEGPPSRSLAEFEELTSLMDTAGDKPVRKVVLNQSNWRKNAAIQLGELAEDLKMCRTLMGFAAVMGLTADTMGEKILEFVDKAYDPLVAVAVAELDEGLRVNADFYWAPGSASANDVGAKFKMADMVPASALGWMISGGPNAGEQLRTGLTEAVKWRSMPWMTMTWPEEQRAVQNKITDILTITRDHLPDAMGEEGMVLLGWDGELKTFNDKELNVLIPEFAIALEITDREKVKAMGSLYEAKLVELLRQAGAAKGDTTVEVPKPVTTKVKDGERFTWEELLPAEGSGLLPTIYLTKKHLVVSSSARLAEEAYNSCRKKGETREWPDKELEDRLKRPTTHAGVILFPEVVARLLTAEKLLGLESMEAETAADSAEIAAAKANFEPILNLTEVLRYSWFHMTNEEGVGHLTAQITIEDLP